MVIQHPVRFTSPVWRAPLPLAAPRLERAGMVRRETDADDGRVVHVAITDTGRAALVRAAPGHVRRVREVLFDGLGPGQLATLRAVLEGMLERLDPATAVGAPCSPRSRD